MNPRPARVEPIATAAFIVAIAPDDSYLNGASTILDSARQKLPPRTVRELSPWATQHPPPPTGFQLLSTALKRRCEAPRSGRNKNSPLWGLPQLFVMNIAVFVSERRRGPWPTKRGRNRPLTRRCAVCIAAVFSVRPPPC